jgi:leucyl aminopeptidase
MKFMFYSEAIGELAVDLLAIGVFQDQLSEASLFLQLDRLLEGQLAKIATEESFIGKDDQSLVLHTLGRLPAARILVVGLGRRPEFQLPDSRRYGASVVLSAIKAGARLVAIALPPVDGAAHERAVQFVAEGALLGRYRFDRYRSRESEDNRDKLERVHILVPADLTNPSHLAVGRAELVAQAVATARDLVNEPAVRLPPRELAEFAQTLARDRGLEIKILGPKECEKQRLRLFLAVAQGSTEEPRFIHLTYRPKGNEKPKRRVVLVGKGITFDSGGLSLKPSASMVDMKTDMAGAAVALTVIGALPALALNSEVHVIIAAAENMISGSAYKIGDIFTGLGGKSVEIVNTDAEGRLTLADALAYAVKLAPDEIIDVATLTGACVVALGPHIAGLMGNDRAFVERFLAAARKVGEDFWPLPLPERLKDQLKSPVADLKNSGERWGAALVAGLFLQEFVGQTPWIHLDVAGPASVEKEWGHIRKGGTGFGVAALLEYLCSRDDLPAT